ncbi:hypothetical protein JCM18901_2556 [Psychrobacter sp. JCM 18901]|nr:hypothetical protein JCM18901_2556 [Psychrobacter sp. JCM 18901]
MFKYAHTRQEVIEQGLDKQFHEDTVMCAITTERQAFTKASRTPLGLLMSWNKQVKKSSLYLSRWQCETLFQSK